MLKFNREIKTKNDVVKYFSFLIEELELNFHPDTEFSDYINRETKERTFTDEEIRYYGHLLEDCFLVCEEAGVDIYEVGLQIQKGYWNA